MKSSAKARVNIRKSFQWSVSSTSISFMKPGEFDAVRDGSDCSQVSPLPQPKRKPQRRTTGKE